jgi:heme exporter protein B
MGGTIANILWKDLKIELRTREAFTASFVFSVLVLVVFSFTLDLTPDEARRLGPGFLWVAFVFAGILSLNRSFALEREENAIAGLLAAPADRTGIYVGKFLANSIFMLTVEIIIVPLFLILFNVGVERLAMLFLILVLGTVGFSSVGTLFAAIAAHTRMREVMLPILLLPVTVPVLIAAVETTAYAMGAKEEAGFGLTILVVCDIIYVVFCVLLSESVLQE